MVKINQNWNQRKAFGWIWLALAMIWTAPPESQAQLFIEVFPSQDNPNQTLWIFAGDSTALSDNTIRSSGNFHRRDSWKLQLPELYIANKPTNELVSLSPLFSSTNHPKDIDSITRRLPGAPPFGPFSTNILSTGFFRSNHTNAPTISIGGTDKNIGWIFMNDAAQDEIGIRGTPPNNLAFTNGQTTRWFGTGILNKPIGDFRTHSRHGDWIGAGTIASPFLGTLE